MFSTWDQSKDDISLQLEWKSESVCIKQVCIQVIWTKKRWIRDEKHLHADIVICASEMLDIRDPPEFTAPTVTTACGNSYAKCLPEKTTLNSYSIIFHLRTNCPTVVISKWYNHPIQLKEQLQLITLSPSLLPWLRCAPPKELPAFSYSVITACFWIGPYKP